jgi:hypothetical protein
VKFFIILAETSLKKVRKYGVLTNFFQKVAGKIRKNWQKSGIGISPIMELLPNLFFYTEIRTAAIFALALS